MRYTLILFAAAALLPLSVGAYTYGSNVITGGTCTAFATDPGSLCSNAIDGNLATYWLSTDTAFPLHWWRYDLGAGNEKAIRKLHIAPYADGNGSILKDFSIEGSQNDAAWTQIASTTAANTTTDQSYQDYEFANDTAYRYYRVTVNSTYYITNQTTLEEVQAMECVAECGGTSTTGTSTASSLDASRTNVYVYLLFILDALTFAAAVYFTNRFINWAFPIKI